MFYLGEKAPLGKVYLAGAGPGDPELITLKALRVLRQADVVLFDALVSEEILAEVRADAECIYVGKRAGRHAMAQGEINALLLAKAHVHKSVVRLKGGDPFVFGRGGEELLYLRAHDVAVEIIPGVSSAIAAAASAGVPVTHRGVAGSFAVVTGVSTAASVQPDWSALARVDTLVVMMGRCGWSQIAQALMAAGRDPATPALAVQDATLPSQRHLTATLATLGMAMDLAELQTPATILVGPVAALADAPPLIRPSPEALSEQLALAA